MITSNSLAGQIISSYNKIICRLANWKFSFTKSQYLCHQNKIIKFIITINKFSADIKMRLMSQIVSFELSNSLLSPLFIIILEHKNIF